MNCRKEELISILEAWKIIMEHRVLCRTAVQAGKDVILEIEIQSLSKMIRSTLPDYIAFICDAAVCKEARRRLVGRGQRHGGDQFQTGEAVESEYMDQYDYLVINDDLDVCIEMHKIIQGEFIKEVSANELYWYEQVKGM